MDPRLSSREASVLHAAAVTRNYAVEPRLGNCPLFNVDKHTHTHRSLFSVESIIACRMSSHASFLSDLSISHLGPVTPFRYCLR